MERNNSRKKHAQIMFTPQNLHDYQKEAVLHMLYNDNAMLWLQMGLGKTIITLTTIVDLLRAKKLNKTIIFGPLRVIETVWETEARKWSHTRHLKFSILRGNAEKRTRALFRDADIYLVNYELMNWLSQTFMHYYISQGKKLPFQCVVYDEVTKVKNGNSQRMKGGVKDREDKKGNIHKIKIVGWRKLISQFSHRFGLTGTPAPNGYLDLHGQFLAIDNGHRLGQYITQYRQEYFAGDYNGWSFKLSDHNKKRIEAKIFDITLKMDAKDYLDMPDIKYTNIMVKIPSHIQKAYKELETDMYTALDSGTEIEVFNAGAKSTKCLQFCNGSPYINSETKEWEAIHDAKLKALDDVLEEAAGSPVLCGYSFVSDAERIMKHFKKHQPINLTKEPAKKLKSILTKWQRGEIKLMIGHPASMGHGIDGLQTSCSIIVWFGLNWSFELYEQLNSRVNRQGQTKPVSIIKILCENTLDLAVLDAIEQKETDQQGLKNAIGRHRRGSEKVNFI